MLDLAHSLLLLGKLTFGAAGLAAGGRLVSMARQGTAGGAHALAAGAIFVGGTGLVLLPVGMHGPWASVCFAGEVLMRLGMLGLCLFVRKVFHPEGVGGALGVLGCGATMAAALAWDWPAQPEVAHYDDTLPSAMAVQLSLALPFAWSAVETGRHWSRSRRRLALGLVDPLVCHRVALWCLATVAFVGICGFAVAAGGLRAAGLEGGAALATAIRGILYLCVVGAVWLGLFPPAAYERHVTARARATV